MLNCPHSLQSTLSVRSWQQLLVLLFWLGCANLRTAAVSAQIVPDNSLPENSRVTPDGDRLILDGGTTAGSNLFHSFEQFNVPTNGDAYFNNAANIERIITRVTGGDLSRIDGLLSANGNASLFLLNPNGIQFGENAQLRLGGSFFASTANSLLFADGRSFDATNPSQPLLSLNVPVGLQFGDNPGAIANRSQAPSAIPLPQLDPNLPLPSTPGLSVAPGRFLGLFGGDIDLNSGHLSALQGQIHLGSVGDRGTVQILPLDGGGLAFDYRNAPPGGRIALTDGATVTTSGLGGGAIGTRSQTLNLSSGASLRADTFANGNGRGIKIESDRIHIDTEAFISSSTFGSGRGGDTNISTNRLNLTGTAPAQILVEILNETFNPLQLRDGIYNLSLGTGRAGNLSISAETLDIRNGGGLLTSALGEGRGGRLSLDIRQNLLLDTGAIVLSGTVGGGDAGNIQLNAPEIDMLNGSLISTASSATGTGDSGDLTVVADRIELNTTPAAFTIPGGLFTSTLGTGNAGDLSIETGQLRLIDGMQLSASSTSAGQGGNLSVLARDFIEIGGTSRDNVWLSGIFTTSSLLEVQGRVGAAGAGSLQVDTQRLTLRDGGRISAATGGQGAAGNLLVTATDSIDISGFVVTARGIPEPTAMFAESRGAGQAGDLRIQTDRLRLSDNAEIAVRGRGTGAAGNLEINARSIELTRQAEIGASTVDGSGGNITLNVDRLQLSGGSQISSNTLGRGAAGNLTVMAGESVQLFGRSANRPTRLTAGSTADTSGRGGSINLNTPSLTLGDSAEISVSSQGMGNAGDARLNGRFLFSDNGRVAATSRLGQGGNLSLQISQTAIFQNNSIVATRAGTAETGGGDGGNINLGIGAIALLDGSRIDANAFEGAGGNIQIVTQGLFLADDSEITASSQFGLDGTVTVQTPDADAGTGLVELPEDPTDPSSQIVPGCAANQGNTFVRTGRGGLPSNPVETLRETASWGDVRDWRSLSRNTPPPATTTALVEASQWVHRHNGTVSLTAPQVSGLPTPLNCRDANTQ